MKLRAATSQVCSRTWRWPRQNVQDGNEPTRGLQYWNLVAPPTLTLMTDGLRRKMTTFKQSVKSPRTSTASEKDYSRRGFIGRTVASLAICRTSTFACWQVHLLHRPATPAIHRRPVRQILPKISRALLLQYRDRWLHGVAALGECVGEYKQVFVFHGSVLAVYLTDIECYGCCHNT